MKHNFEIPPMMAHLKIDDRGYPIPFFAPIVDGKPIFRNTDRNKIIKCVNEHLCGVCGKKLFKDYSYIISGRIGMGNRVSSDAPMHRPCAEFSLMACPHLFFKETRRIDTDPGVQTNIILTKPDQIMLIRCRTKFKWVSKIEMIFRYEYKSHEPFEYVGGRLQKILV